MPNNSNKKYALNQSPFYYLSSKRRLAVILNITPLELNDLTQLDNLYIEKEILDKKEKKRSIQKPKARLKSVQERIFNLLSRIELPDFLFCPAKGRSYISNAQTHIDGSVVRSVDIKKYFPSTPSRRVYWFFNKRMQCSQDVASILTALSTFKGQLPTGSPLSPILSYYAHIDMWEAISEIADKFNCTLTVYMDDVVISGLHVPSRVMWQIKQQIHRCGLHYHKEKHYAAGTAREVTGVIIRDGKIIPPNRRYLKMYQLHQQIQRESDPEKQVKLHQQLQGSEAQVRQILEANTK